MSGPETYKELTPEQPPKDEKVKDEWVVGVKQNPDGTMDFSKATTYLGRKVKTMEDRLEIPKTVKPGTASAVWHSLRNTILQNRETVKRVGEESNSADSKKVELINKLELEQEILGDYYRYEPHHQETAESQIDLVDAHILYWQDKKDNGENSARISGNSTYYPIELVLSAAEDLRSKLIDEAARGGNH